MAADYVPRLADKLISELVEEFPALLVSGPRAAGKTTTAARYAATELRLDRPDVAAAVQADPDAALRGRSEPILIDEWQLVPDVLGAVKRAVDTDRRAGRFIITGSVYGRIDSPTWPGTGRLIHVRMNSLVVKETLRRELDSPTLIDTITERGVMAIRLPEHRPDLKEYVELAARGGFPEAVLNLSERARLYWSTNYLNELFTRDVGVLGARRDVHRLARFFSAYALNTAGVFAMNTLLEAARIDRRTAEIYEGLLTDLYIVDSSTAWSNNRLKRLIRTPKRYVTDTGIAVGAVNRTVDGILNDHTLLGRLLDTFVAAQLRAEFSLMVGQPTLHHLREQDGRREIDLLVELPDNRIIGLEVKAGSAPSRDAAKHLIWLGNEVGDRFIGGVVLHTGQQLYPLGDNIVAAPICALWA